MPGKEDKANKLISFYNDTTKTVEDISKVKNKKTIYWEYGGPIYNMYTWHFK